MEEASRPAFGRTKHELLAEEAQLNELPNDRYHYGLLGFLQKRRGGGGSSASGGRSSGGASLGSSSPSRGSDGSSNSGPSSGSPKKPSPPQSGSRTGALPPKSPSKPKSPISSPPKAPKLPKLPKPNPGMKPSKGSLPGYTPGQPPYHGPGGHLPAIGGGHSHDHDHASPVRSCIHPKGIDRLRCEKPDAIIGTLFAIMGLLLAPLLIYMCIMKCKRRRSTRKISHEEDGIELTRGGMDCEPTPQIHRDVLERASDVGLSISTSQETFRLAKEESQERSFNWSPGQRPPPAYQPSTRSVSRGRKHHQYERSLRSVTSSLSSGMIRTAMLGQALQDPTIIDMPPTLAGSRKDSDRSCSRSDVDGSSACYARGNRERHDAEDGFYDCFEVKVVEGDGHEGVERRSRSPSPGRCSHVSDQGNEDQRRPDDAETRWSIR